MSEADLREAVRALPPGWSAHVRASVGSTQDEARALADAADRTIVLADVQMAGRGRSGRTWLCAPGQGLLMSIVLRSEGNPMRLTASVCLAVCDAIERLAPSLRAQIKWPNDVLIADRKVAGILAEGSSVGASQLSIIGVGVNVAGARSGLGATSVSGAVDRELARAALLVAFAHALDAWLACATEEVHAAWRSRLWGRGQRLRLTDGDLTQTEVVVVDADFDGALRVQLADGSERRILTGELL